MLQGRVCAAVKVIRLWRLCASRLVSKLLPATLESRQHQPRRLHHCGACGRAEYVRHFTTSEMVVGPVLEARLAKTLLPGITAAEVARLADECRLASSCVIKATAHRRCSRGCRCTCRVIL